MAFDVNTLQKALICAGLLAAAVAAAIPPWIEQAPAAGGAVDLHPAGVQFVMTAQPAADETMRPDFGRLAVEWAMIGALAAAGWVAAGIKKSGPLA